MDNILEVDNCATRLRVSLTDGEKIDEALLKSTGAAGVFAKGNNIQVTYGPKVSNIKTDLEEYIQDLEGESKVEN